MPLMPCAKEPFVGTQQYEVPFGTTISGLIRNAKVGGADWTLNICNRSGLPIYGVELVGGVGVYNFLPSTQANVNTLLTILRDCLLASQTFVEDLTGTNVSYLPGGEYPDYLYRKLYGKPCNITRYEEQINKVLQFFNLHAPIAAFDYATYQDLTYLTEKLMREIDKSLMIAPGQYFFDIGSAANTALEAWFATSPTLIGLYSIEAITT